MKNTAYSISESSTLVASLIARSEEGKINWEEARYSPPNTEGYEAPLEGDLEVRVWSDRSVISFGLGLKNATGPDRTLLSVSLDHDPKFGYDIPGEYELHESIVRLHELARRAALKVDQNLASARDFLARLAS